MTVRFQIALSFAASAFAQAIGSAAAVAAFEALRGPRWCTADVAQILAQATHRAALASTPTPERIPGRIAAALDEAALRHRCTVLTRGALASGAGALDVTAEIVQRLAKEMP